MSLTRIVSLSSLTMLVASVACGGSDDAGASAARELSFRAQGAALPGFSYDTGLQPASGPARMSLKLAAEGLVAVDNAATLASGTLTPKPTSGKLKLDVHMKLAGTLKVDAGAVKYDGLLPGLSALDVPIGGETAFDGFLLSGPPAEVIANIPETKLPDIPLGTVPGHLSITVAAGSKLTTSFRGTCVTVNAGKATYSGVATTSGSLVLKTQIVLDLPLVKPIDLPPMTVPVPSTSTPLASAPVDASGAADTTLGDCAAGAATDGGTVPGPGPGNDGGTVPGNDGGTVSSDGAVNDATLEGGEGGVDLSCSSEPSESTCSACCENFHPGGEAAFSALAGECLCGSSVCGTECGNSLCQAQTMSAACKACVAGAAAQACFVPANIGCAANAPCALYDRCFVNNICAGK